MDVGIFAKIFPRATLEATLDAVQQHGIHFVQFNMACAGLTTLPDQIPSVLTHRIRDAFDERNLTMSAISGTYNMIHPNPAHREEGLRRLRVLINACDGLGVRVITVCTGTRDAQNMWRKHADNDTVEAWSDLIFYIRQAVVLAQDAGVQIGVEPELSNVIDSAPKARRLLDEIGSPVLRVVMDASNLLHVAERENMQMILNDAFDLLGHDVALVHAKDLMAGGPDVHGAAGTGVLDYDLYLDLLRASGYNGPLILHTLREDQVEQSVRFLRSKIVAIQNRPVRAS